MSVNEAWLGFKFFYGILAPDTTLAGYAPGGVFRAMAPPEDDNGNPTQTPFVVMALQSPGADSITMNAVRMLANPLFQVKAVGPANVTQQIANAAERIDVLLGGKDGLRNQTITGGFIGACYRESVLQLDELVGGELYTSLGGLWRLQIQQTT